MSHMPPIAEISGAAPATPTSANGVTLAGLGISRSTRVSASSIHLGLITEPDRSFILVSFTSSDPRNKHGAWAEKIVADAVYQGEPWTVNLLPDAERFNLVVNGAPVFNKRGYPSRLWAIAVDGPQDPKGLVKFANAICEQINNTPRNREKVTVNERTLFWLPIEERSVWTDAIGPNAAYERLVGQAGNPCPGFFEKNVDLIHAHFHPKSLSLNLARKLFAPASEVHPSQLSAESGIDKENVDPSTPKLEKEGADAEELFAPAAANENEHGIKRKHDGNGDDRQAKKDRLGELLCQLDKDDCEKKGAVLEEASPPATVDKQKNGGRNENKCGMKRVHNEEECVDDKGLQLFDSDSDGEGPVKRRRLQQRKIVKDEDPDGGEVTACKPKKEKGASGADSGTEEGGGRGSKGGAGYCRKLRGR